MHKLTAIKRTEKGKQAAKRLRKSGIVPAVIYGESTEPLKLSIKYSDLRDLVYSEHGAHALIELTVSGDGKDRQENVMIKEAQRHPMRDTFTHIDFVKVDLNKAIRTKVTLEIIGEAAGVVDGGVLQQVHREVEIECLPGDLPDSIEVDVSELAIGHAIIAGDLLMPAGVTLLDDVEEILLTIIAPTAIIEEEEVTEVEIEPELIGGEKQEESE